ncbi:MAG TPA: hypothetical protein VFW11_15755 [Cyclobacteriaceae bacterium]|nr:hypothetical protein [Cyclobacteriaceae bacterium]
MKEIVDELKKLDLKSNPYDKAKELISKIQKYGLIQTTLHPNKVVIRARPNRDKERHTTKDSVSFKPSKFNTTYQRASTPNNTMFYGCVVPEKIGIGEPDTSRVTAIFEASDLIRNDKDGEEIVTFSKWVVTKDIPLITIVYSKDYAKTSVFATELNELYLQMLKGLSEELRTNSLIVSEFFANEFAKLEIVDHTDYLISAIFTELLIMKGQGGVYYPSVRTEGAGFNVAIHPDYVNGAMSLQAVGECTLYKKGKQILMDNDTFYILKDQKDTFQYQEIVDPTVRTGRETMLKILNGEIKI